MQASRKETGRNKASLLELSVKADLVTLKQSPVSSSFCPVSLQHSGALFAHPVIRVTLIPANDTGDFFHHLCNSLFLRSELETVVSFLDPTELWVSRRVLLLHR